MWDVVRQVATALGLLLIIGGVSVGAGGAVLALPVLFGYGLAPDAVRLFAIGGGLVLLGIAALGASDRMPRRPDET
jgi:hypothetical protein